MAVDVVNTAAPKVASFEVTPTFKHAIGGLVAVLALFMVAKKIKK